MPGSHQSQLSLGLDDGGTEEPPLLQPGHQSFSEEAPPLSVSESVSDKHSQWSDLGPIKTPPEQQNKILNLDYKEKSNTRHKLSFSYLWFFLRLSVLAAHNIQYLWILSSSLYLRFIECSIFTFAFHNDISSSKTQIQPPFTFRSRLIIQSFRDIQSVPFTQMRNGKETKKERKISFLSKYQFLLIPSVLTNKILDTINCQSHKRKKVALINQKPL